MVVLALKGSDGEQMRDVVKQLPAAQRQRAHERSLRALRILNDCMQTVRFTCWAGDMGESTLQQLDFNTQVLGSAGAELTTALDTRMAAEQLYASGGGYHCICRGRRYRP